MLWNDRYVPQVSLSPFFSGRHQHRPKILTDLFQRPPRHIATHAHFHEAPDVIIEYGGRYSEEGHQHIVCENDEHANAHEQRAPVALQGAFAFGFRLDDLRPAVEQLAFVVYAGAFDGREQLFVFELELQFFIRLVDPVDGVADRVDCFFYAGAEDPGEKSSEDGFVGGRCFHRDVVQGLEIILFRK